MACISFSDEAVWVVARWVVRQLYEDVKASCRGDEELARELDRAIALDGLRLDMLAPALRERIVSAMLDIVRKILAGAPLVRMPRHPDPEGDAMYRRALAELLAFLEKGPEEPRENLKKTQGEALG